MNHDVLSSWWIHDRGLVVHGQLMYTQSGISHCFGWKRRGSKTKQTVYIYQHGIRTTGVKSFTSLNVLLPTTTTAVVVVVVVVLILTMLHWLRPRFPFRILLTIVYVNYWVSQTRLFTCCWQFSFALVMMIVSHDHGGVARFCLELDAGFHLFSTAIDLWPVSASNN